MQASAAGFTTTVIEGVRVALNVPTSIDIVVELGEVAETVVVAATGPQSLLNAANAELNTNIGREQIRELPLNGRGVTQLVLTQAGVTGPSGARTASISGTRGHLQQLHAGRGQQPGHVHSDGRPVRRDPPQRELHRGDQRHDRKRRRRRRPGRLADPFRHALRGNTFATEVFVYHRNEAFNANNFFNKAAGLEKERLREHEYGFNVGGPIVRNKAFFFFNYEEERQPATSSVARTVLTDAARRGDFSYVRQDTGQAASVNLFNLTGIAPDPAMQSLVASTPGPNDASVGDGRNTAGYRFNSPDDSDSRWLVFRGDYVVSPRHSLKGTFHRFTLDTPNSVFNDIDAVFPGRPGAGQGLAAHARIVRPDEPRSATAS